MARPADAVSHSQKTISYGLFHFSLLHGDWMSRLRISGASALSLVSLLTLWAVAIALWKPQPIHLLELYQIEGGPQLVDAMKGIETAESSRPLLRLQKHLQQISPNHAIHRIKVRVIERKSGTPNQVASRAILAVEADGRLELQRLQEALRGWNADSGTPLGMDSTDPSDDKQKRWAAWKRDIARHQLMLLSASVDRPEVRKIASATSMASYQTSDVSQDQSVSPASPEQQWKNLLEESSTPLAAASPDTTNVPIPSHQAEVVCRSAGWHAVAGPMRFGRLLAATATPLFLWATYRWLTQLAKWRATRSRGPWTQSLQSMGLLSFGRLECPEEPAYRSANSSRNWNLGRAAGWCLEVSCYALPLLVIAKAILNPTWGRFFFSEPIAALPKLLEWW